MLTPPALHLAYDGVEEGKLHLHETALYRMNTVSPLYMWYSQWEIIPWRAGQPLCMTL